MVAGRWHVALNVDDRAFARPTENGLLLSDLRTAAKAHGLVAFAITADRATLDHELRAGRPIIVGLLRPYSQREAISHYEVVVAERGDQFVTLDPGAGWRVRTWAELEREWKLANYPALVVLGPVTRDPITGISGGAPPQKKRRILRIGQDLMHAAADPSWFPP